MNEKNRAREQAENQVVGISEMVNDYEMALAFENWEFLDISERIELCQEEDFSIFAARREEAPVDNDPDEAREIIKQDPLSIEVRSDWHCPGSQNGKPDEFMILLCTGGPAVRIIGDLNEYCKPCSASVEYQDRFTPWENYPLNSDEKRKVLEYCSFFYFGD